MIFPNLDRYFSHARAWDFFEKGDPMKVQSDSGFFGSSRIDKPGGNRSRHGGYTNSS